MKKTLDDVVLEMFEDTRESETFKDFTDQEFAGYATALVLRDNCGKMTIDKYAVKEAVYRLLLNK